MDRAIVTWIGEVRRFNRRLHLVSPSLEKTLEDQVRHTMEILACIREGAIADLGSGSGVLGIPYKVANPAAAVCLIERSSKKCLFLRHAVQVLGLKGVQVEEADPLKKIVGPYPALMSRSFSPRESLVEAVLRTLAPDGRFYYLQTGSPDEVIHPGITLEERISRVFKGYTLNLDRYLVTSR